MTHGDTKVYTIVYYFGKYININKLFVNKYKKNSNIIYGLVFKCHV